MLHILWMLLKIIGMILLIILGILILSVCAVLFVPVRYQGKAKASGTVESIQAEAKFSWLLHLISGYVLYENKELSWQIRVLWKKLNVTKESVTEDQDTKTKTQDENEDVDIQEKSAEKVKEEETVPRKPVEEEKHEETQEEEIKEDKEPKKIPKEKKKKKYTFQKFCDKIKLLIKKKEEVQAFLTNEIHQSAWRRLKREFDKLLRCLRPKKLTANLHFGFEDPAITGKVLAAISILYPFYGDHINVEPEFDEKVLEGDIFMKGIIRSVHLAAILIRLLLDKNVRITFGHIQNRA